MKRLLFMAGVLIAPLLQAKTLYYGSERENVSLSHGVATLLRFDEEVKTITQATNFRIQPANSENPDYKVLSVQPLSKSAKNNVSFILANDVVIHAKLTTVRSKLHESTNTFYDFRAKSMQIEPGSRSTSGSNVSEVELMKAMIRADKVVGYKIRSMSQRVRTGIDGITAKLLRVYSGPKYHGYIFRVSNVSKKQSFALDVKSLTLGRPNVALLSQADANILYPDEGKNVTILRIVAKPTSVYYAVTLPVAPIQEKTQ